MKQEINVLKACRDKKQIVKLIDVIEDSKAIIYILKYFE